MSEGCDECLEVERLKVELKGVKQEMSCRDVEHDTIIQGVATRMDNLDVKFEELKKEVRSDVQSIKSAIPDLFKNAINEVLAKAAKWFLLGILGFALVIMLAMSRPIVVKGLQEITEKVQTFEATK